MKDMKHRTYNIGLVLGITMLLAGVQGAFAGCMGTALFRAPSDWTRGGPFDYRCSGLCQQV